MLTRDKRNDAARFRAHADQLRAEACDADSEYDRQQLLEQARLFDAQAALLLRGETHGR